MTAALCFTARDGWHLQAPGITEESTMDTVDRNQILSTLAHGGSIADAAEDTGHTRTNVLKVANDHGWPDRDKIRWALDEYEGRTEQPKPLAAVDEPEPEPEVTATLVKDEPLVELLEQAAASPVKRTRTLAERVTRDLADLRARINDEQAKAEAIAEVARLEEQLRAAREKAGLKTSNVGAAKHRETSRQNMARLHAANADYDVCEVRAWAKANGVDCPSMGRFLPRAVVDAWRQATQQAAS